MIDLAEIFLNILKIFLIEFKIRFGVRMILFEIKKNLFDYIFKLKI